MFPYCRLKWESFKVTSSSLRDKKSLKTSLRALGADSVLTNDWSDSITHVAMEEIILTIKVGH